MELLEIGVKMWKGVFFVIRRCFRSVCDHPFLVGVVCFLIFLYRSSPFIFSMLLSASPVLVCTAVLLGTLLSFGQPNIPEMEREEKTTHEVVSVKMGISRDATVIDKNERCYVEKKRDEGEQVRELGDVHREEEIQRENGEIWEANRELGVNEKRLSDEESVENQYASIPMMNNDEHLQSDYEKSEADSFDSERVNVDSLDSPPRSPWKRVDDREEEEDEEEEENDAVESGSDEAESSSPDASMADIIPMLDELHPLLDEETPQPDHMSHDSSDAGSESSSKSSMSSDESNEGTENNKDLEVADEDNEDGEDDVQGDEQEQMKSAITWTEEDQKNLMDLGSSEIERNQRLENLILRRRARKNMSMVPERNLINLESFDLGFNIAPISTARKNPFDLPRDSYDNMGLPPIPGSAPSILLARQNPFDIPYDSSEEKPDLMGDGFQEEFTTVQSREPFFRRHESFSVGPSIFAPAKQERQNAKLRPYFVPEQMASEESSYSLFQRQSSELSDSKVSSVPETESIGSVEDMVERGLSEEDNPPEPEAIIGTKEAAKESSSGDPEPISKREDIPEEDMPGEPELISTMEHVSEHVGHGSQSSEEDEPLEFDRIEKRDVEQDEHEFQLEDAEDHYGERGAAKSLEVQVTGYHPNSETVEDSRGSSSSSFSEVSKRVFNETEGELSMLGGRNDGFAENPGISTQISVGSDLSVTLVEGMPLRDPVYDSSPPADRNNSSSSMSSDVHIEADLGFPPMLVKQMVSFTERESEGSSAEMDVPSNIEMSPKSSKPHYVIEHGSGQIDMVEIREHDKVIFDSPRVEQRSSLSVNASVEENLKDLHIQGQISSSSSDKNIQGVVEYSEDKGKLEEEKLLSVYEIRTVEISAPLMEGWLTADHSIAEEETVESPAAARKNFSSLMSSDVHIESDLLPPELVKKMVSVTEMESEGSSLETNVPANFEKSPKSATPHSVIEHELGQIDVVEISEHDDDIFDSCRVERLTSSVEASVEENLKDHHTQGQVPTSSSCENTNGVVESSEDEGQLEEEKHLVVSEKHTVKIPMPLMECRLTADHSISEEGTDRSPNSDTDVYHEANEKLISTPSAEGNVSFFDGSTIHERNFEHVNEVQVPNTPVGSFEERQRIQILNIDELDQKISENLNSPLSPDFVSIPSMSSGPASPHVEMQTIIEEDDEIKDIDEELLSELDSVGDFTVKKWGPASDEFERHEIMASAHSDETSTLKVVDVNPFETSKIENASHSNSKEEIDVHEDLECISQLQTRDTGVAKSIYVSNDKFDERDDRGLPDQKMTKENTMFSEGYEDMSFGISQVDTEVIKDVDLLAKKDELASLETEARDGPPEASPHVDIHTTSVMPETEAQTTEDVGLMFKKTDDKEIEKSVVSDQPHSELVTGETTGEQGTLQVKMGVTYEMPVIDATLDHKQVNCVTIDNRVLPESEDHRLHVIGVRETQGISSDLHVAQAISPEGTSLPQKLVLDGNIEEQLNPSSIESIKGRGKISKSSGSSSSSESSSSDSDRE